jgi:hypothetical protein
LTHITPEEIKKKERELYFALLQKELIELNRNNFIIISCSVNA